MLRKPARLVARLLLGVMLYAQAALVLAACDAVRRAPALAFALAQHRDDAGTCHEQGGNANLCLAHCLGGDQSVDTPVVKIAALSTACVLFVPLPLVSFPDAFVPRRTAVPPAAAPPPRILFQSLLI